MRNRIVLLLIIISVFFAAGCRKDTGDSKASAPVLSERYEQISETDINGNYSIPIFKNISDDAFQTEINDCALAFTKRGEIISRKNYAVELISVSDIEKYDFYEIGNYKIHNFDDKFISFSLCFEQRFENGEKFEFVKQSFVFNYDVKTGQKIDASILFKDEDKVSEYIAKKLHERLLSMGCLKTEQYNASVFKNNILSYCAIMPNNKVAVITTSGKFDLKVSAGTPIVEIIIPEEYYS